MEIRADNEMNQVAKDDFGSASIETVGCRSRDDARGARGGTNGQIRHCGSFAARDGVVDAAGDDFFDCRVGIRTPCDAKNFDSGVGSGARHENASINHSVRMKSSRMRLTEHARELFRVVHLKLVRVR